MGSIPMFFLISSIKATVLFGFNRHHMPDETRFLDDDLFGARLTYRFVTIQHETTTTSILKKAVHGNDMPADCFLQRLTSNPMKVSGYSESLASRPSLLIPRFAEQCEHIFLVRLYARLVKRVDTQQIAADTAGLFEKYTRYPNE